MSVGISGVVLPLQVEEVGADGVGRVVEQRKHLSKWKSLNYWCRITRGGSYICIYQTGTWISLYVGKIWCFRYLYSVVGLSVAKGTNESVLPGNALALCHIRYVYVR